MLADDLRKKVDSLWNKFWAGGLANPLVAIDQMNYLIFLKRLEDTDDLAARRAEARGEEFQSVFAGPKGESARWSHWRHFPADAMLTHVQSQVFPWLKNLAPENHAFTQYLADATFLIHKPSLLVEAVNIIDELAISDQNVDTQGDIYEYMLSKLSVAGQIGQFRTPRHIIRAMVEIVDPKVGQTIMDPACGTGGFLIAAYQHMVAAGTSDEFLEVDPGGQLHGVLGDQLSDEAWEWLRNGALFGYDFDPTMVRIAAMNMVLHGIANPQVEYADSLGKGFSHAPRAHIVLANPPFSGSIEVPEISDDFVEKTRKTELLFVELIMDLLMQGGRSAVIVPQGVLLAGQDVPRKIRDRLLRQNMLEAVISLPHSTFKPYASVSTAILVFRKGGSTGRVWMYRVENDGYSQDGSRSPIDDNDLPDLLEQWRNRDSDGYEPVAGRHRWVGIGAIGAKANALSPHLYLQASRVEHDYPVATIGSICTVRKGATPATRAVPGDYPLVSTAEVQRTSDTFSFDGEAVCIPTVSSTGHGHASIKRLTYINGRFDAATIVAVLQAKDPAIVSTRYLYYFLETHKDEILVPLMQGAANVSLSLAKIRSVEVPLPPIEKQEELITQIIDAEREIERTTELLYFARAERDEALVLFKDQWFES